MSEIEKELDKKKNALNRIYKFNVPISIVIGVLYSFIYPYIPRKGGRPPMIEEMEYIDAITETAILFFILLFFSMYFIINKKKKKIEELEREVYVKNKNTKQYKSVSKFD